MQGFKYVLVAVLAICATQSQAAEYPISADKVDLRLFVDNGAAIARNMFKAVNTGLDQCKPNVDAILNELAPEARTLLRKFIDEARTKFYEENERITYIFKTLSAALDTLKRIKTCSDKVSPQAKKLALATEKELVNIYNAVEKKYKKEIENLKIGAEKVIKKARVLFDTEVAAVVKCLTPGNKDATKCLNKEVDKILEGITGVAVDATILLQTASDTAEHILEEVIQNLLPLLDKTFKDGKVILNALGDCVAALKP